MTLATRVEKEPKEAFVEIPPQCRRTELKYRLFGPVQLHVIATLFGTIYW